MNAVVTVVGKDRVGIIAAVCAALARCNINILDISQTVMQGYFTMMMVVDTTRCELQFPALCSRMEAEGERIGVSVRVQREEIFDAMHRV